MTMTQTRPPEDTAQRPPDIPGPRKKRGRLGDHLTGWGFVAPAMVIVLGLSLFPAIWALVLSFQDWNGFATPEFVGGDNYSRLMSDSEFWDAVTHTALYVALFVPASVLAGLFLAVALNRKIRFIGLYRTAIFVPFVASAAATGILASYLFSPQYGLANNVLRQVGAPAQGWLEDPSQAMVVVAIMSLWGQAAFTTVIYLAALQDIPPDLLEAARIDGASRWQTFWQIVWPELGPITVFVTIWQTIGALQLFDLVYTTTRGGPLDATKTIVYFLWEKAFRSLEFGYGSAAAYVLFAVTVIITAAMVVYTRRRNTEAF
ncbi:sugar ABC transporter permease [Herbiconiux sp. KACC 21604]|uniref:carbohydrate ABC transporter permease n=1 Tax=unclassified Herbiconiux TaxID=2618217 RepID=UPI001490D642|nr:sugar ABC transporter permease [Herbiconiux sp. SALV-R1]QJU54769.1 sugar ABC transporter permease [Herbiconiux sp. SALV-R1]WPO85878.1 sugar ABC transporter permease [Herbiconiux sp. KACC 21604]